MTIHAYDEIYLSSAQNTLGHAVDFAVMTLNLKPKQFELALKVSASAKQFSIGNPRYVAGINGCEFARCVLDDVQMPYTDAEDIMYLDKSPEYWAGWALAYYQWYSGYSLSDILYDVSLDDILLMYPIYHEMDISQFTDRMQELMKQAHPHTMLRELRENAGISQAELAAEAGVPLRQIQLFEQKQRDINKTSALTLYKLSRALCCSMEDLLELHSS